MVNKSVIFAVVLLFFSLSDMTLDVSSLKPRVISPRTEGTNRCSVIRKGENSIALHSGYVLLKKGESIGKHNTGDYEELIVVLKGEGAFAWDDNKVLKVRAGETLYCPPGNEHDVKNAGSEDLEYIYVVAKAVEDPAASKGAKDAHS